MNAVQQQRKRDFMIYLIIALIIATVIGIGIVAYRKIQTLSYENGKAVCSDGRESANYSSEMMEMFTNTSDFNAAKVNQALKEHWGIG